MPGGKGVTNTQKESSKIPKGAGEKITEARSSLDLVSSSFSQKKQTLDAALKKTQEPINILKARQQQAKIAIDAARKKADAAKKLLEVKELAHKHGKSKTNKAMNDAKATAEKAKKDLKDKQRDFQKSGELVKQLIAKIESQAKGVKK
jgi:hypothetical protein